MQAQRWVVVADSPFLPARGGGEQEHLGFLTAAHNARYLACLVIPTDAPLDQALYRQHIGDSPLVQTPRARSPIRLAHPFVPFVVLSRPTPRWLTSQVRELAPDATGIVVFSYKSHRIGQQLAEDLDLPAVLRQHNREGEYHRSLARGAKPLRGAVLRWEARKIVRDEARLDRAEWLSAIADISRADAESRRGPGVRRVVHIPPFAQGSHLGAVRWRAEGRERRVLFLGALDVTTNVAALDWFLDQIWSRILARCPDAHLDVVGRSPSERMHRLVNATPAASLHADVPDLGGYFERAAVAVNPAVSGSGVNIKVIDYLRAGVPLVSTSLATRGLALTAGKHLEVHDDPEQFAIAVVALLGNSTRAAEMADSGRRRIDELIEPVQNLASLAALLDRA
jgi:polysaccharide biosynthesis protein PslH